MRVKPDEDWKNISPKAVQLIKKMLTLNPRNRISAKEVLHDPWLNSLDHPAEISKNVLDKLSNFHVGTTLIPDSKQV